MVIRKLGKLPARHDKRTLKAAKYLNRAVLPAPPLTRDWTGQLGEDVGLYDNDRFGDCAFAATAHMEEVWTSSNGKTFVPETADILAAYSAVTGFDPNDPSTDNGSILLDVLNYWRNTGICGRKIAAFVQLDHTDITEIETVINLFGPVYFGANLPKAAQNDTFWSGKPAPQGDYLPGSWGGHCMSAPKFDHIGPTFLTWGKRQAADWMWWLRYVDECYCVLSEDWFNGALVAPSGFDIATLKADLSAL